MQRFRLTRSIAKALIVSLMLPAAARAEQLVLDLDMEDGLLYLAHHIENFLFDGTASYSEDVAGNLSRRIEIGELSNYLVATALITWNGEVVGMGTEQEYVYIDEATGLPHARSAWLISLNHPELRGVLAVEQTEDAGPVFAAVGEVMANPEQDWPNEFERYLSTAGDARITTASEGLARFNGATFVEYNYINPADWENFGRFRGRIQFVITTADGE